MKIKNMKPAKERIKEAYISFLKENPSRSITVTEIVKKANINRSTFYDNYGSIDEVANDAIDDLSFNLLKESMEDLDVSIKSASIITKRILVIIKDNHYLFSVINKKRTPLTTFDKYLNSVYFKSEDNLFKAYFFRAGTDAIIERWIKDGCKENVDVLSSKIVDLLHKVFDK